MKQTEDQLLAIEPLRLCTKCKSVSTIVAIIEKNSTLKRYASLNSNLICIKSTDNKDIVALTPDHFLAKDQLVDIPEPTIEDFPMNSFSRWKLLTRLQQHFWTRSQRQKPSFSYNSVINRKGEHLI
jgi:hypothetical protein